MKVGTKSILFGAHAFWLHGFFVARAWTHLYGFPYDPRLWFAFFLHDLGYFNKPNMDGAEGETHTEFGAKIMHWLFDNHYHINNEDDIQHPTYFWYDFCLYHSRYYSKKYNKPVSKLCYADKLSFVYTPKWLYIPMAKASSEIYEYLDHSKYAESEHWKPTGDDINLWYDQLKIYIKNWVIEHIDGNEDTWTKERKI